MSDELIQVQNVSLTFKQAAHRPQTLRDAFVQWTTRRTRREVIDIRVLKNISMTVRRGDRLGVLGVNGAGKSTLCRALAGFYNPHRGCISRFGQVRAIFFTAVGIYPDLTGRENGRLLLHFLYPQCPERHEELLSEALEFSELGPSLDFPFRTYSNGMQARLCLSLVSCLPSDVLILDEVFDGADQFFQVKIARRILSLIERSGAVVFVSHSTEQLAMVCNRALVLVEGRIGFDGDVRDAIEYYRHTGSGFRPLVEATT